jgi:hypothetical protein
MTDALTLQVSTDGGTTFSPVETYADLGVVTDIATHPNDDSTAYALFSIAATPKILRTPDLGQTWEDISGFEGGSNRRGFPDVAVYSLLVMPNDDRILWAGTEIGLFLSEDGGASWSYGDTGLPAVAIWQMRIVNDQVIVATHGRGIWSATLPELASHTLELETVPPVIRSIAGGADGRLLLRADLPAAFDSLWVFARNEKVARFGANESGLRREILLSLAVQGRGDVPLFLEGYREGITYRSVQNQQFVYALAGAQTAYETNFEEAADDFLLAGFAIKESTGLPGVALHSPHPYEDFMDLTAQLLVPIRVASSETVVQYDEIVRIEPGKEASVYGDVSFFDYVAVEGSDDGGLTWQTLGPGYDSRFAGFEGDGSALMAPPAQTDATEHRISLAGVFEPGDEIIVRFRLFSDNALTGWGWAIDNV